MSSGIILLIVAIVLLVIIAYLVGVIIRKRNDSLITSLEERKQALFALPVNDEIEEVKSLHLIGQSQTSFREWNQKWTDLTLNSFADIENHIFEAENLNDTFNFIRAKHEISSVESQLNLVEEDITSIREALGILKEQEEKIVHGSHMPLICMKNYKHLSLKMKTTSVLLWLKSTNR